MVIRVLSISFEVDVDIMHRISSTRVLQCIMLIVLDQDCTYSKVINLL